MCSLMSGKELLTAFSHTAGAQSRTYDVCQVSNIQITWGSEVIWVIC